MSLTLCPVPPLPALNTQDSILPPPAPPVGHLPTPGGLHSQAGPGFSSRLCTITHLPSHTGHSQQLTHGPVVPMSHHATCKHCSPPLCSRCLSPSPLLGLAGLGEGAESSSEEVDSLSWRVTPCSIFKLFTYLLNEAFCSGSPSQWLLLSRQAEAVA